MDMFVEQLVSRKKGAREHLIVYGTLFAALLIVVCLGGFLLLTTGFLVLPFLLAVLVGWGAWWIIGSQSVEYEYSVTNGDIDIDRIVAQRRRQRIVAVAGKRIESLAPYRAADHAQKAYDRRIVAAPSDAAPGLWCFAYHGKRNGHTLVIFQPEDRVLNALIAGLPSLLQREVRAHIKQQETAAPTEE